LQSVTPPYFSFVGSSCCFLLRVPSIDICLSSAFVHWIVCPCMLCHRGGIPSGEKFFSAQSLHILFPGPFLACRVDRVRDPHHAPSSICPFLLPPLTVGMPRFLLCGNNSPPNLLRNVLCCSISMGIVETGMTKDSGDSLPTPPTRCSTVTQLEVQCGQSIKSEERAFTDSFSGVNALRI